MSTIKINISNELMKNYKQAELMSPEKKFEALQTNSGCSLLFSIGTDNVFYVTQETTGDGTGWVKTDLSTAQMNVSFPSQNGLSCKTFEAAQSVVDGTMGMAMVINDGTNDHLFLCLGNSNSDTSWVAKPVWVQYPFDNPAKNVTIANIFLSETINNTQYIVVDILRDPSSVEKLISRYYINSSGTTPAWQPHDVSIDLEADSYSSCLGRQYLTGSPHQPTIDGLYTVGQVDGNPQFIFQPLYNVYNPEVPATSAKLALPNNLIADAMASCRKSNMATDLYVCSNGGLYFFASNNQNDGAVATSIMQNTMFNGVSKMYAYQSNSIVTVWGLNENDQIFYTTCPLDDNEHPTPSAWSYPLPVANGVDLFSPYINCVDYGNTFFAVAENTLQKLIKSTQNTTWQSQSITLPTVNTTDTQKYSSYTTLIQVTDENNQPVSNSPVTIAAATRTGVYINHLYHVLDTSGTQINTDQFGNITVIEWVTTIVGTKLNITGSDGKVNELNPMDTPFSKVAAMNTVAALKNATITNTDGSTKPLVSPSISSADLQTVATANGQLGTVYTKLTSPSAAMRTNNAGALALVAQPLRVNGIDAILVDAGDLFNWIKSGVKAVIQIVEDEANNVWHFVATIAGQAFSCILDCVEKIVGAVQWIYNIIKTAIEDLIQFLEYLFGWQDILITHRVMKNVFTQFAQQSIDNLSDLKTDITSAFTSLQKDVNKWANIPSFGQTAGSTTSSNQSLAGQNSAPANLGLHHYQGNASSADSAYTPPTFSEANFQKLLDLLNSNREKDTLSGAYDSIKTDIIDQFQSLTVTQIIEKFIAIVTDTLLQTAENIILAVVDTFITLAQSALNAFTATIDIPVISWLYKEISGDDLSFLDLICLVAAIPATIIYKIGSSNAAPFPKGDDFTNGLLDATSFSQIQNQFYTTNPPASFAAVNAAKIRGVMTVTESAEAEPLLDETKLKVFGIVVGMFAFAGSIVLIYTTTVQRLVEQLPPVILKSNVPQVLAIISAVANVAYISPNFPTIFNIKSDNWYQQMNNAITEVSFIKGFVNIPLTLVPSDSKWSKVSPGVESVINLVWNVPVIMNIIDNKDRYDTDYKSLIPESIGNFAFNLGGILELPIALVKDIKAKAIVSLIQFGLMGVYGLCMPIAGGIYEWAPNQKHS